MQIAVLIFKTILAFLSFNLASEIIKKVSELKYEKGWTNTFHNVLITVVGMVYLFFISLIIN